LGLPLLGFGACLGGTFFATQFYADVEGHHKDTDLALRSGPSRRVSRVRGSGTSGAGSGIRAGQRLVALSRVVGIDQGTMQVLEKHRLAQEADRSLVGPEWVVSDLLFTSQLGQVIHSGGCAGPCGGQQARAQ
jgi:hypothetical protein